MFILKYSDYIELSLNMAASTNMTQQKPPRAAVKKRFEYEHTSVTTELLQDCENDI